MKYPVLRRFCIGVLLLLCSASGASADGKPYSFGVLNQRSAVLTAQYWNPILEYVSRKSGLALELKMGKTAPETSAMIGRSEFDFVYSNTIFTPTNAPAGYRVFARPVESAIQGQIVVAENSHVLSLKDLDGKEMGFPSLAAFVGYAVPMNALLKEGVRVTPLFAGNQEGIMGQLKAGRVPAAGVNSEVMRDFGRREGFAYRVLWSSENYLNLPISAHRRIAESEVESVRSAFLGMVADPEGAKILQASAAVIKQRGPYGFVGASDREYENYRRYFKTTLVTDCDGCQK